MLLESLILGGIAMNAVVTLAPGLLGLYALTRPRVALGEGYRDAMNIMISPTLNGPEPPPAIRTEIYELGVDYPPTLDPGLIPTIKVPVNYFNTAAGTYVFCRIKNTDTGALVANQLSSLILFGGNGSKTFTFSMPGEHWIAVMPSVDWRLTIECGISWL